MASETVLITGASSGIGLELAKRFAADGSELILVARRLDRLQKLADELHTRHGTKSTIISSDLARPEAASELVEELNQKRLTVDILINNAGFGQLGPFEEIPLQRQLDMVQVNISSLVALSYLILPGMQSRKKGVILNIGSTASFQPGPNVAVYYATKAFVLSFSEALWKENQRTGVHIACLCPGPTRTEFGEESAMHNTPVFKHNAMDVQDVVTAGYRAIRKKKRLVVPGLINKLLSTSVRFTPRVSILDVMTYLQPVKRKSN